MNIKKLLAGAACTLAMAMAPVAHADTISWTLFGVTFNDGASLSGTFETDSVTGALQSFDFVTSDSVDSNLPFISGFHYEMTGSSIYGDNVWLPNSFVVANGDPNDPLYGFPLLSLAFANALNAPGTIQLLPGLLGSADYGSFESNAFQDPWRVVTVGGYATSSIAPIPEPETYAMMLAGLVLLGAVARRRRAGMA